MNFVITNFKDGLTTCIGFPGGKSWLPTSQESETNTAREEEPDCYNSDYQE